ncbi:MAG: pknB 9 [Gemmataceae bacterium]|nr:pknB 9 [Gemmataceae bacterium]
MATSTRLQLRSPFLQAVIKSGLLPADDLVAVLSHYDPDQVAAAEPIQLATFFVRKKLLTKFQAMQLLNGRTQGFLLGKYKIVEGIRQDRVGMVFLAEDTELRQTVMVKVLPTDRVADDTVYRPFLREARLASRVNNPSVARVLDIGVWNGTHYVACEYVPAPTLDKVLAEKGPLPPNTAAQVIAQAAVGLMHAHAEGLLHRDVKPANIALFPDRRVKLLDLGLTHMLDNPWAKVTKRINLKEYAEEIAHIPPEQAWGCELDARSDIYSLGSTAYTLLTGEHPFPGPAAQMMTDRQVKDIPKPSAIRPGVPPELDKLVQKMGAKDPHVRFQSAADLVAALHPWLPVADWAALGLKVGPTPGSPRDKPDQVAKAKHGFFATIRRLLGR